jgi:tetratricopeptide (TPR) repeat protein
MRNKSSPIITILIVVLIVTNILLAIFVVSLMSKKTAQKQSPAPQAAVTQTEQKVQTPEPNQGPTTKEQMNVILAQYDVIKKGRYSKAIETYKQSIRNDPPYTGDQSIGQRYGDTGEFDKGIAACEQQIKDSPQWPENFYALAWLYAKIDNYDKAIEVANKAIALHPNNSKIWQILAWTYAKRGETDKAMDACNQSLKLEPSSPTVNYAIGRLYTAMGNHEKALEYYKKAIELKSDAPVVYLFLGMTYMELGNIQEAIKTYNDGILADQHYSELYFFLGAAYDESGQYKKAADAFEKAIQFYTLDVKEVKTRVHGLGIKPDMANINCILGSCYLRLNQLSDALHFFQKAIEIDDSHAEAHYGLALTQLLLGDKNAALAEYEKVKTLIGEEKAKPLLDIINK